MNRFLIATALAVLVSGCATPHSASTTATLGPEPSLAQAERAARGYLATRLKNPDSVKNFAIVRAPIPIRWYREAVNGGGNEQGWMVCFQYNAKNSSGAYTGTTSEGIVVRVSGEEAQVVQSVNWLTASTQCPET